MELDCVWRINPSMVIKGNRRKEKVLTDAFLVEMCIRDRHYPAARQSVLWNQYCNLHYGSEKEQGREQDAVY